MIHINSQYISGLLKPCTRFTTPFSSIIVKTDRNCYISRYYYNYRYTDSGGKNFFALGFKPLAQWVN